MESTTPRRRPAPAVRAIVLLAAITCLGLTMCHSERRASSPQANAAEPAQPDPAQPSVDPAQSAAPAARATKPVQAKRPASNPPAQSADPTYFPATKAAGPIR
jgi:hypothetical protein